MVVKMQVRGLRRWRDSSSVSRPSGDTVPVFCPAERAAPGLGASRAGVEASGSSENFACLALSCPAPMPHAPFDAMSGQSACRSASRLRHETGTEGAALLRVRVCARVHMCVALACSVGLSRHMSSSSWKRQKLTFNSGASASVLGPLRHLQ